MDNCMKKRKIRAQSVFLIVGVLGCILAGCSGKMTPRKIVDQMEKKIAGVSSFSNRVELDIKMEEVVHYTKVTMDMTMENTMDPKAGHAKGNAEVVMGGVQLDSEMEIYQIMEEGKQVTYSGLDGQWNRETAESSSSGIALDTNLFTEIGDSMDQFQLAEQPVEVGGKNCYEMYGNVTGQQLVGVLGSQMIHGFGLVELPDDSVIAELEIPIIFDVYQEELLPARMQVDMTEVLNILYDQLGEKTDVSNYAIKLLFEEYNQVKEIQVPQEIRQNALPVS